MARGKHPHLYFKNPKVDKPIEQIYEDLDGFTDEVFAENTHRLPQISAFFILPPLLYKKTFVKGILCTQAADLLLDQNPHLQEYFHLLAYSMWSGVPRAARADGVMMCYDNPQRETWFKQKNPDRAGQQWIPHDDTDLFDDEEMSPVPSIKKNIDILCIARLDTIKNLEIFAAAVKHLRRTQPHRPLRVVLNTGSNINVNWSDLADFERTELRKLNEVLGSTADYIHIEPTRQKRLSDLYNRAKCVVMCALCEGKNRSIHEAMSCDVPVVTFAAFNQYARNKASIFPEKAGLVAPEFTPESLAETLAKVLDNPEQFTPRQEVLRVSGRVKVLQTCLNIIPYYRQHLPMFEENHVLDNLWLNAAIHHNYHRHIWQHLYNHGKDEGMPAFWHKGLEDTTRALNMYADTIRIFKS